MMTKDKALIPVKIADKATKSFRIRSRAWFLTYSQLPSDIDQLEEKALVDLEMAFGVTRNNFEYAIARENHEDGNPHLHVYLRFNNVQKIYNPNKLDLSLGIEDAKFHGKYESARSHHASLMYLLKDNTPDQLVTNIVLPIVDGRYYTNIEEHLYAVLQKSGLTAAKDTLYDVYPREAIKRGQNITRNLVFMAEHIRNNDPSRQVKIYDISEWGPLPRPIVEWTISPHRSSLVLYGRSGTGKTELAKSILAYMNVSFVIVTDRDGLKSFDPDRHKAIIFDDLNLNDVTREQIIAMMDTQNPTQVRVTYGNVPLDRNTARIFTSNRPHELLQHDPAIERRVTAVEILEPLYLSSGEDKTRRLGHDSYRPYKVGTEPIHPALEHLEAYNPSLSSTDSQPQLVAAEEIARVGNLEDLTATTPSQTSFEKNTESDTSVKKKRGRPKGSKSKSS